MAKKSPSMASRHATPKKSNRRSRPVIHPSQQFRPESNYVAATPEPRAATAPGSSVARTRFRSTVQMLSSDYHYVVSDLKRIGVTAGILVAFMILLTFVVR
ncbi:MAG: hypothetical protein Q7O66_21465 [Dehalococcoidia bacterium]|nr:hypothetical protein [Dehalococcoidia bacterium]